MSSAKPAPGLHGPLVADAPGDLADRVTQLIESADPATALSPAKLTYRLLVGDDGLLGFRVSITEELATRVQLAAHRHGLAVDVFAVLALMRLATLSERISEARQKPGPKTQRKITAPCGAEIEFP